MKSIKTVLIDDEMHCNETLEYFIKKHLPVLNIMAVFTDPPEGLEYLRKNEIDLLFLDVQMPRLNGFAILEELQPFDFEVIFVTAFDEFAIKAIKYSALDFIQKPVQKEELIAAVKLVEKKNSIKEQHRLFDHLLNLMKNENSSFSKISLPTSKGYIFFDLDQIMWCEAQGNYSLIKIKSGEEYMASKNLKSLHETLEDSRFLRCHNSYVINKVFVKSFVKADGGHLEMEDGKEIPVSRGRKDQVLKELL